MGGGGAPLIDSSNHGEGGVAIPINSCREIPKGGGGSFPY